LKHIKYLSLAASILGILACAGALAADDPARENAELKKKVEGLESSINEIKEILSKRAPADELQQENAQLRMRVQNLLTYKSEGVGFCR